ncbi:hypothetical protein [Paractinoplanes rishiriensis]|uniref:hypothetical protein n=1 Tax=Paractinoplanes rishiriensis TaxID=1050105 RepID=UPI0019429CD8|nr:hypothetical protein [Actinoplanes rishiriensis]
MNSVTPAIVAGLTALLGVLIGSWRQAGLQRSLVRAELIRSWQDERRTSYLNLLVADDEFYRSIVRGLRDDHPEWTFGDPSKVGEDQLFPPPNSEERREIISRFDKVWHAGRAVELYHLIDDDLLASAKSLLLADAELISLTVFDLTRYPDEALDISLRVATALQKRRSAINHFMHVARLALNVPPSFNPAPAQK